jgi:CelD/BcsL family acetyltransferase involved in cellulose biosynthesis
VTSVTVSATRNPTLADVECHQRVGLDAIEPEWRSCPQTALRASSPSWLRTWWAEFGGGRELVLLAAREEGRLVGVVPLMRDGETLTFAGNTKVCDYMDFPCADGREQELLEALFRALGEEPWKELSLWAMRQDSPALAALPAVCAGLGHSFATEAEDVCPGIDLPADWEEYLSSLGKKDRHELRRSCAVAAGRDGGTGGYRHPGRNEGALDDFLRMLRESRSDKANSGTAEMERFFRSLAVTLAGDGLVEMLFLRLSGVRRGCSASAQGTRSCFTTAATTHRIRPTRWGCYRRSWHCSGDRARKAQFDFLRGHERYKYELGAQDVTVFKAVVARGSV